MKRTILVAMVVCAVFFITASSCFAQVIYGCVKNSGDLIIVSGPGQCKANQTPISWNQAGPEGPQGPQGPAGAPGAQGPPDRQESLTQYTELSCTTARSRMGSDSPLGTHRPQYAPRNRFISHHLRHRILQLCPLCCYAISISSYGYLRCFWIWIVVL